MINDNKTGSYNVVQFKQKPKDKKEETERAMAVELAGLMLRGLTGRHPLRYHELTDLSFEDKKWLLKLMREQLI